MSQLDYLHWLHTGLVMVLDFHTETDGIIKLFKFNRSTDAAIIKWSAALEEHIGSIPQQDPFFILLDVTGDGVEFTSLARNESKRIFTHYRTHQGYLAFVFEWRTSPYFARLFFASIGKLAFKLKYFTEMNAAREWLQEMHGT